MLETKNFVAHCQTKIKRGDVFCFSTFMATRNYTFPFNYKIGGFPFTFYAFSLRAELTPPLSEKKKDLNEHGKEINEAWLFLFAKKCWEIVDVLLHGKKTSSGNQKLKSLLATDNQQIS